MPKESCAHQFLFICPFIQSVHVTPLFRTLSRPPISFATKTRGAPHPHPLLGAQRGPQSWLPSSSLIPPTVSQLPAQLQPLGLLAVSHNPHSSLPQVHPPPLPWPRALLAPIPLPGGLTICSAGGGPHHCLSPASPDSFLWSLASPGEIGVTVVPVLGLLWG